MTNNKIIDTQTVKRILIIKLRGIGDVILSSIVFDALKSNFPDATIDFLTQKPSDQVLKPLPFINDIILFERGNIRKKISLFRKIRNNNYDLVLDFYTNPSTAQLTFFSAAKYRAGFPYRNRKFAYNIYGPEERDIHHAAELHLKFLDKIGLKTDAENKRLYFGYYDEELQKAIKFRENNLSSDKLLFGISPSGGWSSKKCPPEHFAKISDALIDRFDCEIIILWGPGDEDDANEIAQKMKHKSVMAPPTSIREMGTFIKSCDFIVANDSGPMHISSAVETPVVGLFGPTSPKLQGPWGEKSKYVRVKSLHCIECNLLECKYNKECFYQLDPGVVAESFDELVSQNKEN